MPTRTRKAAFYNSLLSDLVIFPRVIWHIVLVTFHLRAKIVRIETNSIERRRLEEELTEVEDLLMRMDEEIAAEELSTEAVPELVLRRFETNPYCRPLNEPVGAFIQDLREKSLLRKRANEIEAKLGII